MKKTTEELVSVVEEVVDSIRSPNNKMYANRKIYETANGLFINRASSGSTNGVASDHLFIDDGRNLAKIKYNGKNRYYTRGYWYTDGELEKINIDDDDGRYHQVPYKVYKELVQDELIKVLAGV